MDKRELIETVDAEVVDEAPQLLAVQASTNVGARLHEFLDYMKASIPFSEYDRRLSVEDFLRVACAWQSWNAADAPVKREVKTPDLFLGERQAAYKDRLRWMRLQLEDAERLSEKPRQQKVLTEVLDLLDVMLVEVGDSARHKRSNPGYNGQVNRIAAGPLKLGSLPQSISRDSGDSQKTQAPDLTTKQRGII